MIWKVAGRIREISMEYVHIKNGATWVLYALNFKKNY
jgi:hypothetical protein